MRALVVAESAAIRSGLRDALRKASYQVLEAGDADEAIGVLVELGPIDLCLIDWISGPTGGLALVRRVRQERDFDLTRLMMVIPEVQVDSMLEAVKAGVDGYLIKPVTFDTLVEKLGALGLRRKGAR